MQVLSGITGNIRTAISLQKRDILPLKEYRDGPDVQQTMSGKELAGPFSSRKIPEPAYMEAVNDTGPLPGFYDPVIVSKCVS
jgi:hypothetical protein